MDFVWFVLIGIVAGWLAGRIRSGAGFGLVWNLVIGVVGAILGGLLFGILGFEATNLLGKLITATVGALILLALLRFLMIYMLKRKLRGR